MHSLSINRKFFDPCCNLWRSQKQDTKGVAMSSRSVATPILHVCASTPTVVIATKLQPFNMLKGKGKQKVKIGDEKYQAQNKSKVSV